MGNYVVIARFDAATEQILLALRQKLADAGYMCPAWPPHITIAAYENIDCDLLCAWTAEFAKQYGKQEIALSTLSVLPPTEMYNDTAVLCLDPAHEKTFTDFYYAFHAKYEAFCTGIGAFNSIAHRNPVIHATISVIPTAKLQNAMEIVFQSAPFRRARIITLEVYTYPMRCIGRFKLKK